MSKQPEVQTEKYDSIFSLFVRVFWTLIGNAIAFFTLLAVTYHKGKAFSLNDAIFWGTIVFLILARFVDFKFWGTSDDEPDTIQRCRKYTIVLLIISSVLWLAAHLINHLFINK
ncbi:MAG: hypothetical protein ABFD79_05200 [Phycisphaerales bacterium]